jgi:toxin ParE1/3/4
MTLELTEAAVSDLQTIRDYTFETWGEDQEEAYLDGLWEKFEEILSDPGRWRFRHDLFPECRIAAQGKHVILFRIQGKKLQVVRILHSAMDLPRHIPNDIRKE